MTLRLKLSYLGACTVTKDGQPVAFSTNMARALLAYLAIHADQPQTREHLAALFYPDQPQVTALMNLRSTLARMRKSMSDGSDALSVTPHAIMFRRECGQVDVNTFESLLAECATHTHIQPQSQPPIGARPQRHADIATCPTCIVRLQQAVELYRGEFLLGLSFGRSQPLEEWLLFKREQLKREVLSALLTLTRHAEIQGDYEHMAGYAMRTIEIDDLHEEAHQLRMRALALLGQRAAALNHYMAYTRSLQDALGIVPGAETSQLHARIAAGEIAPPPQLGSKQAQAQTLPVSMTPFLGREEELIEIAAQLQMPKPDARLLTLTGWGGMGKTRLAIEVARTCLGAFPDGVFFASLAALNQPSDIVATLASAVGLASSTGDLLNALLTALHSKHVLLVLDNLEHLLGDADASCAKLVVKILEAAPHVHILATSRERLNVRGERIVEVQGMPLIGETMGELSVAPPVRLFVQRARLGQSSFKLTEANAPQIARICRLVHGMPLGLELAAAWVSLLSVEDIAAEIERSVDFLTYDWPDAPARQRSMRAMFDSSWQLLTDEERQVLRQLSVFRGGFTHEAAKAVAGASWQLISRLLRKSLIRQSSPSRYDMHELVRQFARERLHASDNPHANPHEEDDVMRRHSTWFLGQMATRERLLTRDAPKVALDEAMSELDNMRQAWTYAVAQTDVAPLRQALYSVWQFYLLQGYLSEGEQVFAAAAQVLADPDKNEDALRLASLCSAAQASMLIKQINYGQGMLAAKRAIELGVRSGEQLGMAAGYLRLGTTLSRNGHNDEAIPHFERVLTIAHAALDAQPIEVLAWQDLEWDAMLWLAHCAGEQSNYHVARQTCLRALEYCQTHGILVGQFRCLMDLIDYSYELGDTAEANGFATQARDLAQRLGNVSSEATASMMRGLLSMAQDDYALAHAAFTHVVQIYRATTDMWVQTTLISALGLARLADLMGDYETARLWLDHCVQMGNVAHIPEHKLNWEMCSALLALHTGNPAMAIAHASAGLALARKRGIREDELAAWSLFGRALEAGARVDEANIQYQQVCAQFESARRPYFAVEALAGLARLALIKDDPAQALAHVEKILLFLASNPCTGLNELFLVYLTCVRVLQAAGDRRADAVLNTAQARLQNYAERISNDALRRSYIEGIAAHRELGAMQRMR